MFTLGSYSTYEVHFHSQKTNFHEDCLRKPTGSNTSINSIVLHACNKTFTDTESFCYWSRLWGRDLNIDAKILKNCNFNIRSWNLPVPLLKNLKYIYHYFHTDNAYRKKVPQHAYIFILLCEIFKKPKEFQETSTLFPKDKQVLAIKSYLSFLRVYDLQEHLQRLWNTAL